MLILIVMMVAIIIIMPTLPHLNTWWDRRTRRGTQLLQHKLIRKSERGTLILVIIRQYIYTIKNV